MVRRKEFSPHRISHHYPVKIKRSFPQSSIKSKRSVLVLPLFDPILAERGSRPVTATHTEHYRLTGAGHIVFTAWVPRSAYLLGEDILVHVQTENASNKVPYGLIISFREELVTEGGDAEEQARRATLFHVALEHEHDGIPERGTWTRVLRLPAQRWCRRVGSVHPSMAASSESCLSRVHTIYVCLKIGRSAYDDDVVLFLGK